MVIKDRLLRGFGAGFFGGVIMTIVDQGSMLMGISDLSYAEWASVFIFGHLPKHVFESAVGQGGHLAFCGFAGILFAWFIPTKTHLTLKGILFGLFVWMSSYWLSTLLQLEQLLPRGMGTVLTDFVTACLFGVALAKGLNWLTPKGNE